MSVCLSSQEGVKAAKPYRCDLCGQRIAQFDTHDVRSGVADGGWYKMRMHPECHRYEQSPRVSHRLIEWDWYDDISKPAFERNEARTFCNLPAIFDPANKPQGAATEGGL